MTLPMKLIIEIITFAAIICAIQSTLLRKSLHEYPDAVCLDGSLASFYHSPIDGSRVDKLVRKYVIYLNGGGYCHDTYRCHFRCYLAPQLCTAATDPVRYQNGILSDDPEVNPAFHDYYKVDIPYCSGDMYVGRRHNDGQTDGFSFGGKNILRGTVEALKRMVDLDLAEEVVLAGSSAGGAGVAFNCDDLSAQLPGVAVRCVVDAAFFYPVISAFGNASSCETIVDILDMGARLWNAPEIAELPLHGWWRNVHQPLFISSAKYDEFGYDIFCGDRADPGNLTTWGYGVTRMAKDLMRDYPGTGLFMPGCFSHVMLNDDYMYSELRVGEAGLTLAETLLQWVTDSRSPAHSADLCEAATVCNPSCKSNY